MIPLPAVLSVLSNKLTWIVVGVAVVGGYIYYQSSVIEAQAKDIEIAKLNQIQLEEAVQSANEAVEQVKSDYKHKEKLYQEREELVKDLREENRELRKKLYREQEGKKPLEELAIAKPGLIEKAVNNGTRKVFECFEKISEGKEKECLEKSE